jgi:hypothetical protein
MIARFFDLSILTQNRLIKLMGHVLFAAATAGLAAVMLHMPTLWAAGAVPEGHYALWVIAASVIAGPLALRLTQGWIGYPGSLGWARAVVGVIVALIAAAAIAGTLVYPAVGSIHAPLMVLTALLTHPWVMLIWFLPTFAAHAAIAHVTQSALARQRAEEEQAMSQLSPLSQTIFYRK